MLKNIRDFKEKVVEWNTDSLKKKISTVVKKDNVLNAVVFNKSLESISKDSEIKYIIIGDNPGIEEEIESKYLCGSAGKKMNAFFKKINLQVDLSNEVIFLNKTPIHSEKTEQLTKIKDIKTILKDTQIFMADLAYSLHSKFSNAELWIVGSSNTKIFAHFFSHLSNKYEEDPDLFNKVYIFKHFSHTWFEYDFYKTFYEESQNSIHNLTAKKILNVAGRKNLKLVLKINEDENE